VITQYGQETLQHLQLTGSRGRRGIQLSTPNLPTLDHLRHKYFITISSESTRRLSRGSSPPYRTSDSFRCLAPILEGFLDRHTDVRSGSKATTYTFLLSYIPRECNLSTLSKFEISIGVSQRRAFHAQRVTQHTASGWSRRSRRIVHRLIPWTERFERALRPRWGRG
jgi:hypothetical protein